jgi:hypothetical protein
LNDALAVAGEQFAVEPLERGHERERVVLHVEFGAGELAFVVGQRARELDRVGEQRTHAAGGGDAGDRCRQEREVEQR